MKKYFEEAIVDTGIGFLINLPINFVLVALCYELEFGPVATTLFLSVVFTVIAIIRKVYVRAHYDKKEK